MKGKLILPYIMLNLLSGVASGRHVLVPKL